MRIVATVIAVFVVSAAGAIGAGMFEADPFSVSVGELRITSDTAAEMDFTLTAPPGHYVYQDRMTARVKSPEGVSLEDLLMPAPIVKEDKLLKEQVKIYEGAAKFTAKLKIPGREEVEGREVVLLVGYQGCSSDMCFMPASVRLRARFGGGGVKVAPARQGDGGNRVRGKYGVVGLPAIRFTDSSGKEYIGDRVNGKVHAAKLLEVIAKVASGNGSYEAKSAIEVSAATFLLVLVAGLLVTLTPCVWPMIPITTSIVLGSKKPGTGMGFVLSSSYVLGLAAAYAILGTAIASAGGLVGGALQSPYVVVAVSALFAAMALSMFGLYDLPLMNIGSGRFAGGGVIASFVLGGVSALVLSPCVGPVVATLLMYVATTGNALAGASLLFVFGLGMGAPLVAIGTFSGAIGKLPKSGAWMVEVKKLFGVLLLAFGVSFLFPLLGERAEWIVSGAVACVVGLGFIAFDVRRKGGATLPRAKLVVCNLVIMAGACTMLFAPRRDASNGAIQWYRSFEEAGRAAAEQEKPMMIDFTAEWCTACKEMDAAAFSDEEVIRTAEGVIPVRIDLTAAVEVDGDSP